MNNDTTPNTTAAVTLQSMVSSLTEGGAVNVHTTAIPVARALLEGRPALGVDDALELARVFIRLGRLETIARKLADAVEEEDLDWDLLSDAAALARVVLS